MAGIDYAKWAQQYYEQAIEINKKIDQYQQKLNEARTPEQKHEISMIILQYEEIHYDLIKAYQSLKERSENIDKEKKQNG
jgi:stalled ribosome rescue protein Dom34